MLQQSDAAQQSQNGTNGPFAYFKNDLLSSVVVFLVALPLCIGIAVAVGVSPARALITGIIGGLVVGIFSGSPLQVSGPAAGLFVIVADIIFTNRDKYLAQLGEASGAEEAAMVHAMAALGCAVVLAGIMQLVAGKMKLGRWFRAVSPAVIKGMLSGIGALILISQFHVMLDHTAMWGDTPARKGLQYLATIPAAIGKCFTQSGQNHHLAALIGLVTIATIFTWNRLAPKSISFIPGALVGILAATAVALIGGFEVIQLSVPENMLSEVSLPAISWFGLITDPSIWVSAFVIALVGSAATLLTAAAIDDMSRDIGVKTDFDQELVSQGVGNMLCGVVGALPMTGVIVRSSANVHAGARTRKSTIMHGAWLLLFVCFLPHLLTYIPKSALGALLVYTGFKLLNPAQLKGLLKVGKSEAAIYLTTLAIIVSVDLLIGVMVGVGLSAAKLLHRFSHLDVGLIADEEKHRYELKLRGAATFLRLPILAEYLDQLPGDAELHVCLEEVEYIDHACFELLMNWADSHVDDGGSLVMDWDRLHGAFMSEAIGENTESSDENPVTVMPVIGTGFQNCSTMQSSI